MQKARDWSANEANAAFIVTSMAEENGFNPLKTDEERAVAGALEHIFCGPRAAHYGWRLYALYRESGQLDPTNISY